MQLFISLDIPEGAVRESVCGFMKELDRFEGIKTVDKQLLHATILFLGEKGEQEREDVRRRFTDACESVPVSSFTCSVKSVGVFPHMNYIKVIWCGLKPEGEAKILHEHFRECFGAVNEREYVPHVTVGRAKYVVEDNKAAFQRLIRASDCTFGTFQATDVRLKASEITDNGVRYRELERCLL